MSNFNKHLIAVAAALVGTLVSSAASAATTTLQSNYVRAVVTDSGVMSSLIYDPTNSGNFIANTDYIAPGIPFEAFGVRVGTAGLVENSNSGGTGIAGSTSAATGAFGFGARWTSSGNAQYDLSHLFYFNAADQRVNIETTITAKQALNNVRISRAVDPDPDNYPGGSANTVNQRGIAGQGVAVTDFVGSLGSISGRPLGLFYNGPIAHNTGIVGSCCSISDPDTYLAGGNLGNSSSGDHGIGLAFNLGNLALGQTLSWNYAYVMGGSLGTIDIPGPGPSIPEPSTLALVALSLLLAARQRRGA